MLYLFLVFFGRDGIIQTRYGVDFPEQTVDWKELSISGMARALLCLGLSKLDRFLNRFFSSAGNILKSNRPVSVDPCPLFSARCFRPADDLFRLTSSQVFLLTFSLDTKDFLADTSCSWPLPADRWRSCRCFEILKQSLKT